MKKSAALTAVFLILLVLAGCTKTPGTNVPNELTAPSKSQTTDVSATPSASEASKLANIPFKAGQLYAVACLGYEGTEACSVYAERYLDSENLPIHYVSSGEYYLIIPRYPGMTVRLYRNSMEAAEGTLIYEDEECRPFIVKCNVSDIFPDVTVRLTHGTETIEFAPYISLKDGAVVVGERGLDLTGLS